jgi:hypothetical protein
MVKCCPAKQLLYQRLTVRWSLQLGPRQSRRNRSGLWWRRFGRSRWQANCVKATAQILVALKRNDEYALNIKVIRRVTYSAAK